MGFPTSKRMEGISSDSSCLGSSSTWGCSSLLLQDATSMLEYPECILNNLGLSSFWIKQS